MKLLAVLYFDIARVLCLIRDGGFSHVDPGRIPGETTISQRRIQISLTLSILKTRYITARLFSYPMCV